MRYRRLIVAAAVGAVLLTIIAWQQAMLHKEPPPGALALWLPFIVLFRAHAISAIAVGLFQFPILAVLFVLASIRWKPGAAFVVLLVLYALCSLIAWLMLKAHFWA